MMLLYFLYDDLVIFLVVIYLTSYVDWNRHTAVRLWMKTIVTSKQRFLLLDVFREEGNRCKPSLTVFSPCLLFGGS